MVEYDFITPGIINLLPVCLSCGSLYNVVRVVQRRLFEEMGVPLWFYPFNIIWPQNFFLFCHFPRNSPFHRMSMLMTGIFASRHNLPGAEYCGTMAKGKSHHGFCPSTHLPEEFSWLPYTGQPRYLITHSWSMAHWLTDWLTHSFTNSHSLYLTRAGAYSWAPI